MEYKPLVLIPLIILSVFTVVVGKPSKETQSTIEFNNELNGNLLGKSRTGFFVWGTKNRAPEVTISVVKKNINEDYTIDDGTYYANGWLEIGKIKVEETKYEHNDFIMQLSESNTGMWKYQIGDRDIVDPTFYVKRVKTNEYKISCNNCLLKTTVYDPTREFPDYYVTEYKEWNFEATIIV
jgi:hypothetical protein